MLSNNQFMGFDGSGGGIKSIQRGTVHIGFKVPNGLTYVNVAQVNPAKSILLFSASAPMVRIPGYSDVYGGWEFSGNIEGGTRIYFRSLASSYDISTKYPTWLSYHNFIVEWQLVEYK